MTDRSDNYADRREREDATVTSLASRALEAIVSRKGRGRPLVSETLLAGLVAAVHASDESAVVDALAALEQAGVPNAEALDFYIPEAARRLGDEWCDDRLSFTDVTIGTARLQRAVRKLGSDSQDSNPRAPARSVLVIALEGQAHTLGATLVTEQLRRMDVSVRLMIGATERDIQATVAEGSFDAIFLTVAIEEALAKIRSLVENLRSMTGEDAPIVVGGAVCNTGLDVKEVTGADHVVSDAREALRLCGLINSHRDAGHPALET